MWQAFESNYVKLLKSKQKYMKLLENTIFDSVSSFIICNAIDFVLDVRLESYSCKMIAVDKKEWKKSIKLPEYIKEINNCNNNKEFNFLSPSEDLLMPLSVSPSINNNQLNMQNNHRLRHLSEKSCSGSDNDADDNGILLAGAVSRRTLFDIVKLLNLSYPDYDFSQTKITSFLIVTYEECVQNVNAKFSTTINYYERVREEMWKIIDNEIKVSDCIIYSYLPTYSGDPFTEDGCIWSFNYLFHNKNLKRFLFFACRGTPKLNNVNLSSEQLWGAQEKEIEFVQV